MRVSIISNNEKWTKVVPVRGHQETQ